MAFYDFFDGDGLSGFDDDAEEWWDEYAQYQEEKDAYWKRYYAKIYYNLPDCVSVFKVNHTRNYYHSSQLGANDVVTYEKLHSIINKTELLFSLWQKRLSHEWNKDIAVPWKINEDIPGVEAEVAMVSSERNGEKEDEPITQEESSVFPMCPHLSMAVSALEQFGLLHEFLPSFLSDEEDSYSYYDDSDDWLSLDGDPDFSDDEELFEHHLRMEARKEAKREKEKLMEENDSKARYRESARKFYVAFSDVESFDETLNTLMAMKIWINSLFTFVLSKSLGRQLPHLVLEKIMYNLLSRHGEIQLNIGFLSKTRRFIDVEKLRLKELYAAVLDIHYLFFEILFKNELVSKSCVLREHIAKLFQIASRRLVMLQEFNSWLLNEDSSHERPRGFMSGMFYCKLIKTSGRDFDYLYPTNAALSSFDGRYLAIMIPGAVKESCIKIFDVNSFNFVTLHDIAKGDMPLCVALNRNELALMLKRSGFCWVEIRDVLGRSDRKQIRLTLGAIMKDVVRKMVFIEFGESRKLLVQKDSDIVVIDVSTDNGMIVMSVEKTYCQMELLAAKGQYMITGNFMKTFTSAKEISEGSKTAAAIKVFDVKNCTLLNEISHPTEDDSRSYTRWSATLDTDPNSLRFILWKEAKLQLWNIDGGAKKLKDIDLGSRLRNGTRMIFNKDTIAVQSLQDSHDSSYDSVELAEIMFYEISTGRRYYHETYHSLYEKPQTHVAIAGGHICGLYMTSDKLISLHSSTNVWEVRMHNFDLSHERMMGLQIKDLEEKRREEELKRKIKEAERKRLNEERMRKKEEQRLKRLNKKIKQKEARIRARSYCVGEVVEWRGSYGFLKVDGIGSVFIHITDIQDRPRIWPGCKIRCRLQEQIGYSRPKAVSATLIHSSVLLGSDRY